MFKDLKQILRKEQCDASILLTANVPSTKKIIVHGPQGKSCILCICLIMGLYYDPTSYYLISYFWEISL